MKLLLANFSKMIEDTGGMAKVFVDFANEMQRRGHSVSIVYSDDREGPFFYELAEGIQNFNLRRYKSKVREFPRWLKAKRELLRVVDVRKGRAVNDEFTEKYLLGNLEEIVQGVQPDLILAFQPAASKCFICDLSLDIPVVTMSHSDTADYFRTFPKEELPAIEKSVVNQVLLPSFVVPLKKHFPNLWVEVIGNVVPEYEEMADLEKEKDVYKILFIGRLVKGHKRPHILINAFKRLANRYPNWNVEIWGAVDKESYNQKMQASVEEAGLTDRIFFKGTTHDVADVLRTGDIFSFPSVSEGWGMSLTEAMAMGLPPVGFRSCPAVNEIIKNEKTGILTDDGIEAYAWGLARLMENKDLRIKLGRAARESMRVYNAPTIWGKWEKLLKDALAKGRER